MLRKLALGSRILRRSLWRICAPRARVRAWDCAPVGRHEQFGSRFQWLFRMSDSQKEVWCHTFHLPKKISAGFLFPFPFFSSTSPSCRRTRCRQRRRALRETLHLRRPLQPWQMARDLVRIPTLWTTLSQRRQSSSSRPNLLSGMIRKAPSVKFDGETRARARGNLSPR